MNNILRLVCLCLLELLLAVPAAAQTVRADRVTLNTGPCVITSGSAAPNGSRVGNVCDTFIQTTSGAIWTKTSGTGTSSGWIATLAGTGTPGTLPVWTSAGAIGDSIIAQAGGVATITGSATITGTGTMNAASITNNASIGGTATIGTEHVTGGSTIDAALAVGGTSTLTGAATLKSILDVTGVTTLRSDTSITGNTVLGGWIGSLGYASQVSGWRLTQAGAADVRYLFTDELRAKLFTADKESVLGGSMRVTKSYSTVYSFTCPAPGAAATLYVYDAATYPGAAVFQDNDYVVIHVLSRTAFGPFTIADCVGVVTGYNPWTPGTQYWTFSRPATGSGTMAGNTVIAQNELVQDFGVSGNGYVEITALDGANGVNAPYIQTNTWTTSPVAANLARQCRLGNLNGVFGNGPEYGLSCGATATQGGFLRLSNLSFEIRNVPIDLYDSATQVMRLDPAGPSLALGSPLPTAFAGSNAGLWAGKDTDGNYKIRIGDPAGNRLTYANGQLTIAGEGSGITNINGGNIQAGTISASTLSIKPIGAALNDDPNMLSSSAWGDATGVGSVTFPFVTDGMVGGNVMRSVAGHSAGPGSHFNWPIDPHKSYRLHLWARNQAGATGVLYAGINTWTPDGSAYAGISWGVNAAAVPTTWTEFNGPLPLASNAGIFAMVLYLNWGNSGGGYAMPGYMEVQDVRVEEAVPSTLIKDGAITTNKILAGTITGDKIAANTINVGNLNATGFGDNLIKNGTFEGNTVAQQLSGWAMDLASTGSVSAPCCGTRGVGTMLLQPSGAGTYVHVVYQAVPVTSGQPYRIAMDVYAATATPNGFYARLWLANTTSTAYPGLIGNGNFNVPAIGASGGNVDLCPNCGLAVGWNHFEWAWTAPASVQWASLAMYDYGCMMGGSTPCQFMQFDAIEMQAQIGPGHIRANSITANQIAAGTITSDQIAANSITVANLNATGFGDNLIKNGSFEGTPAHALDGWKLDTASQPGSAISQSCCGTRGPGLMLDDVQTNPGSNSQIEYLAVPVIAGASYRMAADVYTSSGTTGFYIFALESNSVAQNARWVVVGNPGGLDLPADTNTQVVSNLTISSGGWSHFETVYIPPAAVHWVSFTFLNNSSASGGARNLYIDNVEMQLQIGAGHIRAGSITADRITAGSITSTQIAANTIVGANIAGNTITGGNIAGNTITGGNIAARTIVAGNLVSNTITSNEIGVRAIVAGNIATGTLTANEIAGGTITGDRIAANTINANNIQAHSITSNEITVSILSAISANLGNITAGNISAVTISGSSVNGTTITGGSININGGNFQVDSSGNVQANGSVNVGGTANIQSLNAGYQAGISTVNFNGNTFQAGGGYFSTWNLQNGGNRFVCADNQGRLYPATNGTANATC